MLANISKTLQAINQGLGEYQTKPYVRKAVAQVRQLHNAIKQRAIEDTRMCENSVGILSMNPIGVIARIRRSLARGVITICDVGEHKMLIGTYFDVFHPRTHVNFNGLSGMGGSVPGGIATKLAFPKKRVMVFCGDGGFL